VDADALAYFPLDGYMVGRVEQHPARLSGEEQAALAQQGDLTLDESVG
jgi:hypothetical protein